MKLTIDTDQLADAAQWALRAIPGNPPAPVLAGMRIEASDDNTLTLAGYDYYRSARAREDCEVSEPGTLLVPGRVFTDIVKAFPKGKPTTLALDGTDLALSCGTAHILLPTLPLDDYPTLPTISSASGTVDGAALAAAAARVAVASTTDETIATLTAVQFGLSDTTMVLSATDRYLFHVADVPWTPNPTPKGKGKGKPRVAGNTLVPADAVRDAARILADADKAELTLTESQFAISVPGRWATSSLIEGELPNYAALFPTEFASIATTGTEALIDAIKHIQPLLGKADPMVLEVTDGQITVRAGTDDKGRGRDQVHADLEGDPLTIAFNPGLLLKTLQQIDGPVAQFNFTTATKPALVHGVDQTDIFRGLVMPIRLTSISG
ncbi:MULTISPECIES: DNA polymerase III subunit beta [Streptomyces]|uniref:Beta sliding clamp n=1 Tax=Streptomyces dengpaensis TaxID=2049881 RepID=A0ABM6T4H7_9ACTN|nr:MULTISPECIES: DNA polymerase III subunit beta [Streptomyces]AVH61828.1 DNA polymerase III subunit beta [Streptomyces dengpaensis]PIB04550.1 DNA polymerase III subunit beta [Streptomyces sp. HG99]